MTGKRFVVLVVGLLAATVLAVVFFVSATALVYAISMGEARAIRIYTGLTAASVLVAAVSYVLVRNKLDALRAQPGADDPPHEASSR